MAAMPQPVGCGIAVPVLVVKKLCLESPRKLEELFTVKPGVRVAVDDVVLKADPTFGAATHPSLSSLKRYAIWRRKSVSSRNRASRSFHP